MMLYGGRLIIKLKVEVLGNVNINLLLLLPN